jgi:hypothetical protein
MSGFWIAIEASAANFFEIKSSTPNPEELCVLHQRQLRTLRAIRRLSPHLGTWDKRRNDRT